MSRQCPEGLTMMASWLHDHPYLDELARLQERVQESLGDWVQLPLPAPRWDMHADDLSQGIPLLMSSNLDRTFAVHAGEVLCHLITRISPADLPEGFRAQCEQLRERLRQAPELAAHLVETQLVGPADQENADPEQGFIKFFCWMALGVVLRPWHESFDKWRQNLQWEHPYCPLCGARPAMAQLTRSRSGRRRLLACGCCGLRWAYQRIGCPFCGNDEHDQLAILEPEEENWRIDVCHRCHGFLKTYTREGEEELMLADWSTLHLDALGMQQGYLRLAQSLYGL